MRARDNPFAVQRLERLGFRMSAAEWETLLARLARLGGRGAILGPQGSGKTALVEALAGRLAAEGREVRHRRLQRGERRLADDGSLLADLGPHVVLLIDGADELAIWEWRRLRWRSRAAGGLVIAGHRAGLLPTLHRCRPSPELLAALVAELHPPRCCALPAAGELYARHGGNLRQALLGLYDLHATRE